MKRALELTLRGYKGTVAFACPLCGRIFPWSELENESGEARHKLKCAAESCCTHTCAECSAPTKGSHLCPLCTASAVQAAAKARLDRAYAAAKPTTVCEYDGPLYWAEKERFLDSVDALLDVCESEDLEVPPRIFACVLQQADLSAGDILDQAVDSEMLHENARDSISEKAEKELQDLLNGWCARQNLESWLPDYSRVILIDQDAKS